MDGALEMRAELGERRGDPTDGVVDRAPHVLTRALGLGCCGSVATAESDRPGELLRDEVELLLRARRPLPVGPVPGLLDLLAQLLDARPVRRLGLGVEGRPGTCGVVRPQLDLPVGNRAAGARRRALGRGDDLEYVDVGAGVLEQHCKIAESLDGSESRFAPAEPKRPVVPLAPEPLDLALGHGSSPRV
jgi:hypothetical protein